MARQQPRAQSLSMKQMRADAKRDARLGLVEARIELEQRPRNRADCCEGERPCPFVSCKYNLFLDVNPETGSVKLNFPDKELDELEETCALDVADQGGVILERVGELMNVTRERIRQMQDGALAKLEQPMAPAA